MRNDRHALTSSNQTNLLYQNICGKNSDSSALSYLRSSLQNNQDGETI